MRTVVDAFLELLLLEVSSREVSNMLRLVLLFALCFAVVMSQFQSRFGKCIDCYRVFKYEKKFTLFLQKYLIEETFKLIKIKLFL